LEQEDDAVIHCIDTVLNRLGVNVRRAIMLHIRRESGLKRYEILQKPSEFIKALRLVLGQASFAIEREIMKDLEKELEIKREENQDLLSFLTELKDKFEKEAQIRAQADTANHEDMDKHRVYMDYM